MRLGRAILNGGSRTIVALGDEAVVLPESAPTPDEIVRSPEALSGIRGLIDGAPRIGLADLKLEAPLARFNRDILCTGWNYWDHYEESAGRREGQDPVERPSRPTFFTKAPLALIGPDDPIAYDPAISTQWDYEAELAIVIGKAGRSIPEDRAMEHVFGLMAANDVSQRDVQRAHGGQWFRGKSIDAATPIGPWITTIDEIDDVQNLDITCTLNGETLQSANTRQMAFPIARLIAELSWGVTLLPGDVLLTGTPSGIGNAREPQIFLKPGDELVTSISSVGELRNTVVEEDLTSYWTRSE